MAEIEERTVRLTSRLLNDLDKSVLVKTWILNNMPEFQGHLAGYNELVRRLNQIPSDSPLLAIMPKTTVLIKALGGESLPTLEKMAPENFVKVVKEAKGPMLLGQSIKKREFTPNESDLKIQIGTTSMETTWEALAVGAAGHLAERTFFNWARRKGFKPEGGDWQKDDWLQALDEAVMLMVTQGQSPHLLPYFAKPNEHGGLGWIKQHKIEEFGRVHKELASVEE